MVAKNKTPEERKEIYEYLDSIVEIFLFNYGKLVLAEWLDEEENVLEDGTVLGSEHKEEN